MINQYSNISYPERGGKTFQTKVENNKPQDKSFGKNIN
jgi:hypothetical protein